MTLTADHFDLIVIGSGAAAASCWSAAARIGKRVAVFEAEILGGECPNFACMPTKALLHCAAVYEAVVGAGKFGIEIGSVSVNYGGVKAWKDAVVSRTGASLGEQPYRSMGVVVIRGRVRFISPGEVEANGRVYRAEHFLVATGASPLRPEIAGLHEAGYLTFREAIDLAVVPSSVLVLGGGPVGCEFSHLLSAFGSRIVLADRNPRLVHREDAEVGDFLAEHFRRRGVDVRLNTGVTRVERVPQGKRVTLSPGDERVVVEEILVATGQTPNTDLGLDEAGIEYNQDGIVVDETLRTTNARVHAAGDVIGPYGFTHAAAYQGRVACHNMFGERRRRVDYSAMPRCVLTMITMPRIPATSNPTTIAVPRLLAARPSRAGSDGAGTGAWALAAVACTSTEPSARKTSRAISVRVLMTAPPAMGRGPLRTEREATAPACQSPLPRVPCRHDANGSDTLSSAQFSHLGTSRATRLLDDRRAVETKRSRLRLSCRHPVCNWSK
jgi:pyruvate/2-oxoglutarate dehydrogenase complex dihydrolipoamide dehydrogenase (E3) component